eukprot:244629-Rhodomonas_salina.2
MCPPHPNLHPLFRVSKPHPRALSDCFSAQLRGGRGQHRGGADGPARARAQRPRGQRMAGGARFRPARLPLSPAPPAAPPALDAQHRRQQVGSLVSLASGCCCARE